MVVKFSPENTVFVHTYVWEAVLVTESGTLIYNINLFFPPQVPLSDIWTFLIIS